jgi:DNA-directed RNA polymerase subunit N
MLIPVRCFTCGKVLADKYSYYQRQVRAAKGDSSGGPPPVAYIDPKTAAKTVEGKVMDALNLNKICCRRHMLTHVDIL